MKKLQNSYTQSLVGVKQCIAEFSDARIKCMTDIKKFDEVSTCVGK